MKFDLPMLVLAFALGGWDPNVNTGDEFDGDDARNFAGYIVGQTLHCYQTMGACPHVIHRFIADWRAKFIASA